MALGLELALLDPQVARELRLVTAHIPNGMFGGEPYARRNLEDLPPTPSTSRAVLIVKACDVLGVVRNARHSGEHRAHLRTFH